MKILNLLFEMFLDTIDVNIGTLGERKTAFHFFCRNFDSPQELEDIMVCAFDHEQQKWIAAGVEINLASKGDETALHHALLNR